MRIAINIIIIAAIFGALMYAVYYAAHKSQPTGAQLGSPEQLHLLADQIRAPASAHRIAPYRVNAAAGGAVGSEYETNQDQNVIYAYYAAVLTDRGWQRCGAPPAINEVPDNNYFRKNPYEAVLLFSPENNGRYVFAMEYGAHNCK